MITLHELKDTCRERRQSKRVGRGPVGLLRLADAVKKELDLEPVIPED